MAAILRPQPIHPAPVVRRPDLRLLHGGRQGGPSAATFRRRRLVVGLLAVLIVVAGAVAIGRGALAGLATEAPQGGPVPAAGAASTAPLASTVVVQSGDTFWSIARRLQPAGDIRPLVDRLAQAHGGTVLQAGERLSVPR